MQKKIPQRQCMGCRERKAKKELIRVVRGVDGTVSRSLETEIPQEVYDRLEKEMEQNG